MNPNTVTTHPAQPTSTSKTKHTATTRLRWWAIALVAGMTAFLAGAPAALAVNVPPPGGDSGVAPTAHLVLASGTPGWQIALIAVGSALLASALTLLAVRATRHATPAQATPIA
ncbi:MAG TPA: hypothetical protein VH520_04865 [Streptosporangiaceae bacterium]|jgi:hypothetical protein